MSSFSKINIKIMVFFRDAAEKQVDFFLRISYNEKSFLFLNFQFVTIHHRYFQEELYQALEKESLPLLWDGS